MKGLRVLPLVAVALATVACVQRQEASEPVSEPATKVVQLSDEYESSSFLVKFRTVPTEQELAGLQLEGVASIEKLLPSFAGKEDLERQFGLDRWYEVKLEEGANLHRSIRAMAALEQVSLAEYNHIATKDYVGEPVSAPETPYTKAAASGTFNDPMLLDQWHYFNQGSKAYSNYIVKGADVNVNDVWKRLICGDPDIVVAVVDEGVKYNHPDLKDNMWVNTKEVAGNGVDDDGNGYVDDIYGLNFVTEGPITWDRGAYNTSTGRWEGDVGHGTHCAGTIAAVNNNGKGVAGIAGGSGAGDGCRIMSCQIFSGQTAGSGGTKATAKAIKYAADMGASVISCSFGYSSAFSSDNDYIRSVGSVEIDAIHYFEASKNNPVLDGNIAIFAAGNEKQNFAHYPGAYVDIISVSSFGPDFLPAYYTNYGPGCNISAPGGEYGQGVGEKAEVLSTVPIDLQIYNSEYGYMQGTSMACPHMSGVVALALSYAKQLGKKYTRDEFKRLLLSSTNDIDQRIANTKEKPYASMPAPMSAYYHQMGTGAIDAWRVMMHIEGTPTSTARMGQTQWINLENAFGSSSVSLTYLSVDVPEATVRSLGLETIQASNTAKYPAVPEGECYAYVQFGRLYIHPTRLGSGKITIKAVGGGGHVGGDNNPPGGMEISEEISIIARDVDGGNGTGGWL